MLRELKRGASKLVEDTQTAATEVDIGRGTVKRSKVGDKASAAKSSWAKSATPRGAPRKVGTEEGAAVETISPNLQRAERFVKTRAAAFTMAAKRPDPSSKQMVVYDAKYNVKVDALSSYKKIARAISFGRVPKVHASASTPANEDVRKEVPLQRAPGISKVAPKAFSFGKAKREQFVKEEQPVTLLNVEHSKSYLEPHTASLVITKAPPEANRESSVPACGEPEGKEQTVEAATVTTIFAVGAPSEAFLSHRSRSPAALMQPESTRNSKQKLLDAERGPSNLGPGQYEVAAAFGASSFAAARGAKPPVGKLYHAPVRPNPDVLMRLAVDEQQREQQLSASRMVADITSSDRHVFLQSPSFFMHPPEPKPSAHLERKQYWEEKARDLRLEHDDMLDADDSVVRPRAPVVLIARPPLLPEDSAINAKMRRVRQERRRLHEQIRSLAYEVKYDSVERKTIGLVDMETAMAVQKKLQDAMKSKPAVHLVLAEKREPCASDRVYGPQLQVPWAPERAALSRDECGSPTKQVMDLLASRRNSLGKVALSEHAERFINSAYSGNLNRKPTVVMRSSPPRPPRRYETFESVLQTQLPVDWAGPGTAVVDFDKLPGRDIKKVITKDVYMYDRFDEPLSKLSDQRKDPIGPGYYNSMRGEDVGEVTKGAPVFDLMVARARAVGPNGERPEGSALAESERALAAEAPTPCDYGRAKDAATATRRGERALRLYERERFEERGQPREGGDAAPAAEPISDFKGIAEAALLRPPVIDFTRMRGRAELERKGDDKYTGAQSELVVKDWNPRLPKALAVVFADPLMAPRFPEEQVQPECPSPLDPQRIDYIKPKSTVTYVNMALQTGRKGGDATVSEARGVSVSYDAVREDPLARGFEAVTRLKRTPNAVSISKQVGRDGQAVRDVLPAKALRPMDGPKADEDEEHYHTDDALLAEILGQASSSPPKKSGAPKVVKAPVAGNIPVEDSAAAKPRTVAQQKAVPGKRFVEEEKAAPALTVEVEESHVPRAEWIKSAPAARPVKDWNFDAPTPPPRRPAEPERLPRSKEKKGNDMKKVKDKKMQMLPAPTPPVVAARPLEPAPPTLSKYEGFGVGSEELLQRELQKLGL